MGRKKVKSESIDGFVYEVYQLTATKGEEIGYQLLGMILPTIGSLAPKSAGGKDPMDMDISALGFGAALSMLADKLNSPELKNIRQLMVEHTEIYGEGFGDAGAPMKIHFDDHFAGRYDAMLEWFAFALEVNFSGFFVGLWNRIKKGNPRVQSLLDTLTSYLDTSIGVYGPSSLPKSQP